MQMQTENTLIRRIICLKPFLQTVSAGIIFNYCGSLSILFKTLAGPTRAPSEQSLHYPDPFFDRSTVLSVNDRRMGLWVLPLRSGRVFTLRSIKTLTSPAGGPRIMFVCSLALARL